MRLRERVLLWLLPALVFRALIPVGFMPGAGPALALELCSSAGFGSVFAVYEGEGAPSGQHGTGSHEPCAFAAGASPALAPDIAAPDAPVPGAARVAARTLLLLPAAAPSLRPQPRAPPGLA
ncbi:MAG: hypothetical protein MUC71_02465 [Steroidobacteraceae bacterium]|jgi:hypothetical protein|nr:hypothetical protein [Steroidobacteraceae bacterium]